MDSIQVKIAEDDYVELTEQVGKWPAGTRGTAVIDHGDAKLVEISDDRGQQLDMFVVPERSSGNAHELAQTFDTVRTTRALCLRSVRGMLWLPKPGETKSVPPSIWPVNLQKNLPDKLR